MIGELNIEEGEAITQNTLLGTHIMTEYVYAEFGIVERDVNKIALGQKARVFIDAYPDKTCLNERRRAPSSYRSPSRELMELTTPGISRLNLNSLEP